jgi:hypothetical protein
VSWSRLWISTAVVALVPALAAPVEAGVAGKTFTGTVDFSLGGQIGVCIAFDPNDNGGIQNIEGLVTEPITYLQVDLFLFSFWAASYGTTTTWSGGFELLGFLAVANVGDELYGQGAFVGFPGTCPFETVAGTRRTAGRMPGITALVSAERVPRMQACRMP